VEFQLRRKAKMWKWNDTTACEQSTIPVAQRDTLVYRSRPKTIAHITGVDRLTGVDRRFEPPSPRKILFADAGLESHAERTRGIPKHIFQCTKFWRMPPDTQLLGHRDGKDCITDRDLIPTLPLSHSG